MAQFRAQRRKCGVFRVGYHLLLQASMERAHPPWMGATAQALQDLEKLWFPAWLITIFVFLNFPSHILWLLLHRNTILYCFCRENKISSPFFWLAKILLYLMDSIANKCVHMGRRPRALNWEILTGSEEAQWVGGGSLFFFLGGHFSSGLSSWKPPLHRDGSSSYPNSESPAQPSLGHVQGACALPHHHHTGWEPWQRRGRRDISWPIAAKLYCFWRFYKNTQSHKLKARALETAHGLEVSIFTPLCILRGILLSSCTLAKTRKKEKQRGCGCREINRAPKRSFWKTVTHLSESRKFSLM